MSLLMTKSRDEGEIEIMKKIMTESEARAAYLNRSIEDSQDGLVDEIEFHGNCCAAVEWVLKNKDVVYTDTNPWSEPDDAEEGTIVWLDGFRKISGILKKSDVCRVYRNREEIVSDTIENGDTEKWFEYFCEKEGIEISRDEEK